MTYAVSLRLDAALSAPIQRLWETLAERGISASMPRLGYPPHLTLTVWNGPDASALSGPLQHFAVRLPLPLRLVGLGLFPAERSVLWAAPAVCPDLLAAHADLQQTLGVEMHEHYRTGRWVPHVTLATDLDAAAVVAAISVLTGLWRDVSGRVWAVDLVQFPPVKVLWAADL
jgi:2'-5' RNA ligase